MGHADQAGATNGAKKLLCPMCRGEIDAEDSYCRHCGRQMGASKWYYSRGFVLSMLFLFVGPLALPLLWRSSRFGTNAKAVITATNIAYTLFLLYALKVAYLSLTGLEELLSTP